VKLGLLEQLGKLYPMFELVEAPGLVIGMPPETGGLMSAAWLRVEILLACKELIYPGHHLHISTKALTMRRFLGLVWDSWLAIVEVVDGPKSLMQGPVICWYL